MVPTWATQGQKKKATFFEANLFFVFSPLPSFSFSCSYLFRRKRRSGPRKAKTAKMGARVSAWLRSCVRWVMSPRPLLFWKPGSPPQREDVSPRAGQVERRSLNEREREREGVSTKASMKWSFLLIVFKIKLCLLLLLYNVNQEYQDMAIFILNVMLTVLSQFNYYGCPKTGLYIYYY